MKYWSIIVAMILSSMSTADDIAKGQQLFRTTGGYGCAVCHGQVGDGGGQVGGYIRGASTSELEDSLATNAVMQPLAAVLTTQDRLDLASYLGDLASRPLFTARFEQGQWSGLKEPWIKDQTIDLVLYNGEFSALGLDIPLLKEPIKIDPLASFTWQGRLEDIDRQLPNFAWSNTAPKQKAHKHEH